MKEVEFVHTNHTVLFHPILSNAQGREGGQSNILTLPDAVYYNKWLYISIFSLDQVLLIHNILSKAGIKVWASQKLNTSFGPVMSSFGVRPLKKLLKPSFLAMLDRILKPLSGFSKLRFWIRVLMTSSGADTRRDADAPAMEAMKF